LCVILFVRRNFATQLKEGIKMTTLLKKLSIKGICGDIKAPAPGESRELVVIMGFARTSEIKKTTFGDSVGFHGDFKGIDVSTGEEFRSATCYLPDVASDLLENALDNGEGGAVSFGFRISVIGVKGRTEGEVGKYEYRCVPLMEAAENDPLAALENQIKNKALAAPKTAPAKAKGGK